MSLLWYYTHTIIQVMHDWFDYVLSLSNGQLSTMKRQYDVNVTSKTCHLVHGLNTLKKKNADADGIKLTTGDCLELNVKHHKPDVWLVVF